MYIKTRTQKKHRYSVIYFSHLIFKKPSKIVTTNFTIIGTALDSHHRTQSGSSPNFPFIQGLPFNPILSYHWSAVFRSNFWQRLRFHAKFNRCVRGEVLLFAYRFFRSFDCLMPLLGTGQASSGYAQAYTPTTAAESTAHTPMALSPENVLFDKYEIGKLLGCGAFAKVYHARDVSTGQSVAVKIINKSRLKNNLNLMNNIVREVSIMSRLRHPRIVKIFEVLATKRKIYFVMEYLKGGELFGKVAKGRFSEDLSRKYFQQLISAVSFCHQRGVYHRDLKLENMLLDENGDLKVSDFGLSAVKDQVRADGLLHTLCGTPAYVAPEILANKGYDGAKADVWSCGIVLFVLTAGYLPFNDQNLMNMYRKIYKGEFRSPKWISPELRRLISRLLDTNPATRITVDEITQDPWFKKGYKEIKSEDLPSDSYDKMVKDLNAFDLISFSRGLDLSGMFDEAHQSPAEDVKRLTAEDSPEGIIQKVSAAVTAENGRVHLRRTKESRLELEGQNENFTASLEVYRLTDRLVVVEVKRKAGDGQAFSELWRDKIRPAIPVSGNH